MMQKEKTDEVWTTTQGGLFNNTPVHTGMKDENENPINLNDRVKVEIYSPYDDTQKI